MTGDGAPIWHPGEPVGPLAECLSRGGVLAVPTESSYALAADPASAAGVAAVFAVKRRPAGKPLPVVAADRRQIRRLGVDLAEARACRLDTLWPAALTLLLPLARPLPAAAGSPRLGVRIPAHDGLRRLLAELGTALTATSANRSGRPPLLDPAAVARLLAGHDAMVVDGGRLAGGAPSTLVDFRAGVPHVLRHGRIGAAELAAAIPDSRFSAGGVEIPVERSR